MDRKSQILTVHAAFINQVVKFGPLSDRQAEFSQLLKQAEENGWTELVAAIRQIIIKELKQLEECDS
jgi:hypothetical protein